VDRGDLPNPGIMQLAFEDAFCWFFFIDLGSYVIILKTESCQTAW